MSNTAIEMNVTGSVALTWNSNFPINRVANHAATNPNPTPVKTVQPAKQQTHLSLGSSARLLHLRAPLPSRMTVVEVARVGLPAQDQKSNPSPAKFQYPD